MTRRVRRCALEAPPFWAVRRMAASGRERDFGASVFRVRPPDAAHGDHAFAAAGGRLEDRGAVRRDCLNARYGGPSELFVEEQTGTDVDRLQPVLFLLKPRTPLDRVRWRPPDQRDPEGGGATLLQNR